MAAFAEPPPSFLTPPSPSSPSRARKAICSLSSTPITPSPPLPTPTLPEPPTPTPTPTHGQGIDAWKDRAYALNQTLRKGTAGDVETLFGQPLPPAHLSFLAATSDVDPYGTFSELRLDVGLLHNPPVGVNTFEQLVLNDQLDFLGTALTEAFTSLVPVGSARNGDVFFHEIDPFEEGDPLNVLLWSHNSRSLSSVVTRDLDHFVYLAALTTLADKEKNSDHDDDYSDGDDDDNGNKASTLSPPLQIGFKHLRSQVNPNFHLDPQSHDPTFVPWTPEPGNSLPVYLFWRANWIIHLLRADAHEGIKVIRRVFTENLNLVFPPENLADQLKSVSTRTGTALYFIWRAYLFDEPNLPVFMEAARSNPARIVRDAAALIDELAAGRQTLGRISDWPAYLQSFRDLDIDPRRAAAREAEAAAKAQREEEDREALLASLSGMTDDQALEAVSAVFHRSALNQIALFGLLALPGREVAHRSLCFLRDREYSRDGKSFSHEAAEACTVAAGAVCSDLPVLLLLLGIALNGSEVPEGQTAMDRRHVIDLLVRTRTTCSPPAQLPAIGRAALLAAADGIDTNNSLFGWEHEMIPKLVAAFAITEAIHPLLSVLGALSAQGGFDNALAYDEYIGIAADTLASLVPALSPSPENEALVDEVVAQLKRFSSHDDLRMHVSRYHAGLALARINPQALCADTCTYLIASLWRNNEKDNTWALLALAQSPAKDVDAIAGADLGGSRNPQVQLALALAVGAPVEERLATCLSSHGYNDDSDLKMRRGAILASELCGIALPPALVTATFGLDPDLDRELAAAASIPPPRWLTWFDCEHLDSDSLLALVQDTSIYGRAHAVRALATQASSIPVEHLRPVLEDVLAPYVDARILRKRAAYLVTNTVYLLLDLDDPVPSTLALFNAMLMAHSRDVKDPILRDPPAWPGLEEGMTFVATQGGGWQKSAAQRYLDHMQTQ